MENLKASVILTVAFLVGVLSVLLFPLPVGSTAWSGQWGGGARVQYGTGVQDMSMCNGSIMYVDAQGETRTLYRHPKVPVPESAGH